MKKYNLIIQDEYYKKFGVRIPTYVCASEEEIDLLFKEGLKAIRGERGPVTDDDFTGHSNPDFDY